MPSVCRHFQLATRTQYNTNHYNTTKAPRTPPCASVPPRLQIFTAVTRERLRSYVQQALKERGTQQDRKAEAAAIKKLVQVCG